MPIATLILWTTNLLAQRRFYTETLGLPLVHAGGQILSVQAGRTRLVLQQAPNTWHGYYHFAFNIPENQLSSAKAWAAARFPLIVDSAGNDTFFSSDWNATMCYFYDEAGNILEFVARHTLPNATPGPFASQHILGISEIGLPTADVASTVAHLQRHLPLAPYGDTSESFMPLGDEHGLLIVVPEGRIWFPDTGKPAIITPATIALADANGERTTLIAEHDRIQITPPTPPYPIVPGPDPVR